MSLEDLRKDLSKKDQASMASLPVDVRQYFMNEVWPFFESLLDVGDEQQAAIDELIEQTEDYLHAETAKEIGKPVGIGFVLADELEKRLGPQEGALRGVIAEYRSSAATALATLRDISIPDDEDAADGEDADGEDDADAEEGDS